MKLLLTLLAVIIVNMAGSRCSSVEKKTGKKTTTDTISSVTEDQLYLQPSDTLTIDKPTAVFFTADSSQRERLKKQFTSAQFDGMDHECFYQMKNSRTSLKEHWPQIKIYEVADNIYLLFKMEGGKSTGMDLRAKKDLCGLILFTPKKEPLLADMTGIGTSLENYFLR